MEGRAPRSPGTPVWTSYDPALRPALLGVANSLLPAELPTFPKRRTLAPYFHCQARRHLTIPFLTLCITDGLGTDSARPWSPGGWCMARQELAETALSPSGGPNGDFMYKEQIKLFCCFMEFCE